MLERRSALAAHSTAVGKPGAQPHATDPARLVLSERRALSVLQVSAFASVASPAAVVLADALELAAPANNSISGDPGKSWRCVAPGVWLLIGQSGMLPDTATLRARLGETATVVDLSHARCAMQLHGAAASRTLAKYCGLDLDVSAFPTGSATNTRFGHIGMHLARVDDLPTFELLVFRGYAQYVFEALCDGAAEFSSRVEP